jgi:hypothetical protein
MPGARATGARRFSLDAPPASRARRAPARRGARLAPAAGLGDAFRSVFDFDSWAPRSSQAWRLGGMRKSVESDEDAAPSSLNDAAYDTLAERVAAAREAGGAEPDAAAAAGPSGRSFAAAPDAALAAALAARVGAVAAAAAPAGADAPAERLDGARLRELLATKYGKLHDVAFVRRDVPGRGPTAALNIFHPFLGQRSFPLSREEYEDKTDGVALLLEMWGEAGRVVDFMEQPPAPRAGTPSRPIVGNAVSITLLGLSADQVAEFFGR